MAQPRKSSDRELYRLLDSKISKGDYLFKKHARQRQKDRYISDLEVLNILEGRPGCRRHRNKAKDSFDDGKVEWKY